MLRAVDPLRLVGSTAAPLRFDECIDAGGFGFVYRGWHEELRLDVAIKCLRLSHLLRMNDEMRDAIVLRCQGEAKVLVQLSQGNHDLVRCLSSGEVLAPETGERVPYLVLEWLDGRTLTADLEERRTKKAPGRTLQEALDLVESSALALAHAHSHGHTHRDVKPGNLMIAKTRGGTRLKLLDLGIAKIISDDPIIGFGQGVATIDGAQLCSPAYAAPEQFSPQLGAVGPWTDVYSLALVLLELMRGERIRAADSPTEGLVKALDPAISSPRASALGLTLPPSVEAILERAVSQKPLARPASAGLFWSALRDAVRQTEKPIANAAALAATASDGDVARAILQVRAKAAQQPPAKAPAERSPFVSTMVMENAPGGGLQLLAPLAAPAERANARSAPPIDAAPSPLASSLTFGTTSPLKMAPPGSIPPAILKGEPPPPSGRATDVAFRPTQLDASRDPMSSAAPRPERSDPPQAPYGASLSPHAAAATRGPGFVIGLLVVLLILVVLGAAALWRLYPSR